MTRNVILRVVIWAVLAFSAVMATEYYCDQHDANLERTHHENFSRD